MAKRKTLAEIYKDVKPFGTKPCTAFWGYNFYNPIDPADDDHVVVSYHGEFIERDFHTHKICYTPTGRPYITKFGFRIYLSEVMKTN